MCSFAHWSYRPVLMDMVVVVVVVVAAVMSILGVDI